MFLNQSLLSSALLILGSSYLVRGSFPCPRLPEGGCRVCGEGCVNNINQVIEFSGQAPTTCGDLEGLGLLGAIPADSCAAYPPLIYEICRCARTYFIYSDDDDDATDDATDNLIGDPVSLCAPVPEGGCSICGTGKCVSIPDAIFEFPGEPATTCGNLQTLGYLGGIAAEECAFIPGFIPQCGCSDDGSPPAPTDDDEPFLADEELPCEFGPDALTSFYGKDIPRTCIDVPEGEGTITRCYYTYIPDSCASSDQTVPLVLDIHGYNSCPLRSSTYTGWFGKAEEECFVVVWPSGEPLDESFATSCFNVPGFAQDFDFGTVGGNNVTTTPCCCQGTNLQPITDSPNDPLFIKTVIDVVLENFETDNAGATSLSLDEDRVYLAGHSNGCITSLAVAGLYSDTIAAVACHSGFLATPFAPDYSPVPIWLIHGEQDSILPYNGVSQVTPFGQVGFWSFDQTANYLATQNECSESTVTMISDDNGVVGSTEVATGCKNGATVETVTLFESGHLPFKTPYPESLYLALGGIPTTTDTTNLAWEFLSSKRPPTSAPTQRPTQEGEVCLNILLTNDDGYETLLINTLFEYLRDETCHRVVMVAPKEGQSGKGTSTDFFVPNLEEGNPSDGIYYLASTPITTMYYALDVVLPELGFEPDLIVSGPNEGWNIGNGGISSGTIAAAQAAMARGNPAIAVSGSLTDGENPLAASRIAEITRRFIDEILIDKKGELILEGGQGFNVNIPTVFDLATFSVGDLDDYDFELTKIGLASPFGGPKYFRDLEDSLLAQLFAGGLFNGQSGLSAVIPCTDAGYPLDDDEKSEGNAIGDVVGPDLTPLATFIVTASPIEFTLETRPTKKMKKAFKNKKSTKAGKVGKKQ